MDTEERVKLVEQAILQMKDLLVSHNGRLDDYHEKFQQSREDFEFKLNSLIDSQIKTEADLIRLHDATSALKEASQAHLERIVKLENPNNI